MFAWGKLAYNRIVEHEKTCDSRWNEQQIRESASVENLRHLVEQVAHLNRTEFTQAIRDQNRMFLWLLGSVFTVMASALGALLHKTGVF